MDVKRFTFSLIIVLINVLLSSCTTIPQEEQDNNTLEQSLYFPKGSIVLEENHYTAIDKVVNLAVSKPEGMIRLTTYTEGLYNSEVEDIKVNIQNYLTAQGVSADRIYLQDEALNNEDDIQHIKLGFDTTNIPKKEMTGDYIVITDDETFIPPITQSPFPKTPKTIKKKSSKKKKSKSSTKKKSGKKKKSKSSTKKKSGKKKKTTSPKKSEDKKNVKKEDSSNKNKEAKKADTSPVQSLETLLE